MGPHCRAGTRDAVELFPGIQHGVAAPATGTPGGFLFSGHVQTVQNSSSKQSPVVKEVIRERVQTSRSEGLGSDLVPNTYQCLTLSKH